MMPVAQRADETGCNVVRLQAATPIHPTAPVAAATAPVQLAMDFAPERLLLVLAAERLHGATFSKHLFESKPTVVLDLRFAPHFSFTATDGVTVRQQIEAVGARYVQDPVPFHDYTPSLLKHDPRSIALKLPHCAMSTRGTGGGALMVLVKEDAVARAMAPFLMGVLCELLGGKWNFSVVT